MKKSTRFGTASVLFVLGILLIHPASAQSLLYGTTASGGANSMGTIFSFNPANNTETLLWSFGAGTDGAIPQGNLTYFSGTSLMYALTTQGGTNTGEGAIISFDPSTNAEAVVHSFGATGDGANPYGSLVAGPNSALLYGLSSSGGSNASDGTVFTFDPSTGNDHVVYDFASGLGGTTPWANMVYNSSTGLFYGTASGGGTSFAGTIFSFNPSSNVETEVHTFAGGTTDGETPYGSLVYDATNSLYYGTTRAGGANGLGTIFSFNPANNAESMVYSFGAAGDGQTPVGDLVYDAATGLYYGMTTTGGSHSGGVIFSFDPTSNAETVLWSFGTGSDGATPYGDLVYDPGTALFYGVTEGGGSHNEGAIFSFNTSGNAENVVYSFAGGTTDGAAPWASLVFYPALPNGINTISASDISIYPNPTSGIISVKGLTNGQTVEVYDYLGQKVSTTTAGATDTQINISAHQSGVYMVTVLNTDGSIANQKKVVKEN